MFVPITILAALVAHGLALADPLVTARAQLGPRAGDPLFVGYISQSGSYTDGRSCDFTETVSTSNGFFQCCPTTGACPFYTSCSGNVLMAASTTVPCDFDGALTCNTGIVLPTPSAANGAQYLACWQKTLGSSPFTFVQDIGSASVAPGSSGSASGSSSQGSSTSRPTSTRQSSSGTSTSTSTSSTSNAAATGDAGLSGGVVGAMALLAQMLL